MDKNDSSPVGVNKADNCTAAGLSGDHRKRKKDNDMSEGEPQPASRLDLSWTQSEHEVSMTTTLGAGDGDAQFVDVSFTDQKMTIKLADGREQQWSFSAAIEKEMSRVQRKKRKFTITVVKKVADMWSSLEAVQDTGTNEGLCSVEDTIVQSSPENEPADNGEESMMKEEEPVHSLDHVKHDFFEKDEKLTVHVYVKNVNKDAVKVRFENQSFLVKFQTGDVKFLHLHEGTSEDTVFCWNVTTKSTIVPTRCKYKVTGSFIELIVVKASLERWATLEAPQRKETASTPRSASWIPARNSTSRSEKVEEASVASGSAENSAAVAFDEMAAVDVNRQRSLTSSPTIANSSLKSQKPTCKVQPLNKVQGEVPVVSPGHTGLDNLGNTCFMNSVIQVLSNTREFRDFFLDGRFQREINTDNKLGTGGHLAVAFGVLLKTLWSGNKYSCAPGKLKDLVAKKASQFTGFAQHDSQEFLAFLLDGLHEDLNRVKDKPYTETVDSDGRADEVVANEAWEVYKKRNDSFVVDLFQGQYKSKLVCPACNKVSITFDPFLYLSVPLPKKKKTVPVTFMWKDPHRKPVKYLVQLIKDSSVEHFKEVLSRKTGVRPSSIRVFEAYRGLIHKHFHSGSDLSNVQPNETIIAAEMLSKETAGEEVIEMPVIQRTLIPHQFPLRCARCHKECDSGSKLKRCTKCLKVGYCDQTCQRIHWTTHKAQCNCSPEPVGCPFILSLPKSHCTYARLVCLMEGFARYSVDTFQPPVKTEGPSTSGLVSRSGTANGGGMTEDLQLPSHPSASNLSSSSGSQSSGSLSSLDSISSCSSTATLTADTPAATFHMEDEKEGVGEKERGSVGEVMECSMSGDVRGRGDGDSGFESASTTTQLSGAADGDVVQDEGGDDKDLKARAASLTAQQSSTASPGVGVEKSAPTNPVLGVQTNVVTERPVPLFFIKPVTEDGHGLKVERLEDKGETPLDLSMHSFLSMDWRNSDKLASYVLVQSKKLDADLDDSMQAGIFDENSPLSLTQCMELFTEPEILSPDEAWYCPRCKKHQEASKQMSVWRLPHTLVVQLKRFSFRNFIWRDKIDKMVDFPVRGLDMSPFTVGTHKPGDPPPIYDLYGVVNHHGGILGGHYTSFVRCADPDTPLKNEVGWRLCDDSRVTQISSEKNVLTRAAYLLFYRRRDTFSPTVSRGIIGAQGADVEALDDHLLEEEEDVVSNKWNRDATSIEREPSEEKYDPEKEADNDDSNSGGGEGRLVMDIESGPKLDYTDMDAVD